MATSRKFNRVKEELTESTVAEILLYNTVITSLTEKQKWFHYIGEFLESHWNMETSLPVLGKKLCHDMLSVNFPSAFLLEPSLPLWAVCPPSAAAWQSWIIWWMISAMIGSMHSKSGDVWKLPYTIDTMFMCSKAITSTKCSSKITRVIQRNSFGYFWKNYTGCKFATRHNLRCW